MIEINLIPPAGKKKRVSRATVVNVGAMVSGVSGRMRDRFLIEAVVALVVSVSTVGLLDVRQRNRAETLAERRDVAVADSTRYANILKERHRAESTRDSLLRQVNLIVSLDEDRYVWPHVMDEVSRALPQYTWITTLTFAGVPQGNVVAASKVDTAAKKTKRVDTSISKDVITVRVQGRTVDLQAVTRFMRDLEASPFFTDVVLEKSEPVTDSGKEIAQFQLTFCYSRLDTLMLRRTPLSLSLR
jgi:Tfp pilus assembly protein PilN